jgi:glycosyltransferase involved in cell wall biosynthesis
MTDILRFVCALDPRYGGVPQGISLISKETKRYGISTAIVSCGNSARSKLKSNSDLDQLRSAGIDVFTSGAFFTNPYGLGGFIRVVTHLLMIEKPKLVVTHQVWTLSTIYGYVYSKVFSVSLVVMPHGSLSSYHQAKSKLVKKLASVLIIDRILRHATHIVVTSTLEMEELDDNLRPKAFVVPYGTDIELPNKEAVQDDKIIFAGRITRKKNLDQVIKSIPAIIGKFPNAQLLIAGDGPSSDISILKDLVFDLGLGESVLFMGWLARRDLLSTMSECSVFVLPSEYENFGHAVMESLASGIPVVVSNKVALANIVSKYAAGVVIESNTPNEISWAISRILENQQEFSANALNAAKNEFSWGAIAKSWRSIC